MPSVKPVDLAVGLVATIAATWASLRLLPPAAGKFRVGALLVYLPHFLWQSMLAGLDIARRALDPRLPLRPGFVSSPTRLPPGRARNESQVVHEPAAGSVPCGEGRTRSSITAWIRTNRWPSRPPRKSARCPRS